MKCKSILTIALAALIWLPVAGAQNLVANPGFENWTVNGSGGPPDDWVISGSGLTASQEATQVDSGTYSCNLTWTTTSTRYLRQNVTVTEGTHYNVSFRYYDNDSGGRVRFYSYWRDSGGSSLGSIDGGYSTDSASWQIIELTDQVAPAGAVTLDFQIRVYDISGWSGSATVYVDNAVVEEVTATETPTQTPTGGTPQPSATPTNTPPPAPFMIINEIDPDTDGTEVDEFIELYDGGVGNTSLDHFVVVLYNGSDDQSYLPAIDLDGYTTDANGYFIIGGTGVTAADYTVSSNYWLQNGADAVALYYGKDDTDFPNDTAPVVDSSLVDAIVYQNDAGLEVLLNPGQSSVPGNDDATNSYQRCPNGSGGARNTDSYTLQSPSVDADNNCAAATDTPTPEPPTATPTEGTPLPSATPTNTPPPAPFMIINEIDPDTDGTEVDEFIELYDGGVGNTSLDHFVVVLYNGSDDQSYLPAIDLDGYTTDANGYFIIGGTGVAAADYTVSSNYWLQNGADAVALYYGKDDTDFPNDTAPVVDSSLVDAIVYQNDAGLEVLLNPGQSSVPGNDDATNSYQRCPNGSGGARNTDSYTLQSPSVDADNNCSAVTETPTPEVPTATPTEGTPLPSATPTPTPGLCSNNILLNWNYEDWTVAGSGGPPDDWAMDTTNFTAEQESGIVYDGSYSVKLTKTASGTAKFVQSVPIVGGNTYDIRIRAYDTTGPTDDIRLWCYWRDSGGGIISTLEGNYSTDYVGWQTLGIIDPADLTAPANAVTLEYQVRLYGAIGTVIYIDSAEVCGAGGTWPTATPTGPTPEPTATPTEIPAINVVINEALVNPGGADTDLEWLEIYNPNALAVDTIGIWIQSSTGVDGAFENRVQLPSLTIPANGYLIVAEPNVDTTGTTAVVYQPAALDLDFQNGSSHSEGIRLTNNVGVVIDTLIYSSPNTDSIPGDSPEDPTGDHPANRPTDDETIARCPNGQDTNYCDADFVTRAPGFITMGAANNCTIPTATPTTPPTETPTPAALVPIPTIQYTTDPSGDSPLVGQIVRTQGVVTAIEGTKGNIYIQDTTGATTAWHGIDLYKSGGATVSRGDFVEVQGEVVEYNGITEISNPVITVLSSGTLPSPEVLNTNDIGQEQWESVLVRAENVTVTNDSLGFGEWEIDDASGAVRVDDYYSYDYVPVLNDTLAYVQGVLNYSYGNFKIEPRDNNDISATSSTATPTPAGGTPTPTPQSGPVPTTGPMGLGFLVLILSALIGLGVLRNR